MRNALESDFGQLPMLVAGGAVHHWNAAAGSLNPRKAVFEQKKTASKRHLAQRDGFQFHISLFSRVNVPPVRAVQRAHPF